jgi:hypothetical protein
VKAKIKGRRVYLEWWRFRWFAVAGGAAGELRAAEAAVLLLLPPLPPLLLFFSSPPSPLFLSRSVFRSLSSWAFFFPSPSLVFIGKNRGGRRGWGGHCAAAPPPSVQHVESGW